MSDDNYKDAVNKLISYVSDTVAFAKEQLPDVAKEVLVYSSTVSTFWLGVGIALLLVGIFSWMLGLIMDNEAAVVVGVMACVLGIPLGGINYMDLKKIEQAPKLYILDEMRARLPKECSK